MTLPAFAPFAERALSRLDRVRPSHLVLAGLLLRVAWIAVCPNAPYSDQSVYHYEAEMIAQGRGYINLEGEPTNFYPVGYPALLGAAYAIFGARYFVAYGLNLLLAVVGMAGAYRLVALLWGERAGKVATLLVAVHPTFILLATAMASENPFCAVLPWTLWLIARLTREPRAPWLAPAAGVAVAAMTFLRPPALLLLSCPAVFGLLARQPLRRWVLDSVIACAFALMVLAPWGLRNQRDFGRFSLTSFNAGINLYMGNNPDSHGDWTDDLPVDIDVLPQPLSDSRVPEARARVHRDAPGPVRGALPRPALRVDALRHDRARVGPRGDHSSLRQGRHPGPEGCLLGVPLGASPGARGHAVARGTEALHAWGPSARVGRGAHGRALHAHRGRQPVHAALHDGRVPVDRLVRADGPERARAEPLSAGAIQFSSSQTSELRALRKARSTLRGAESAERPAA